MFGFLSLEVSLNSSEELNDSINSVLTMSEPKSSENSDAQRSLVPFDPGNELLIHSLLFRKTLIKRLIYIVFCRCQQKKEEEKKHSQI